MQMEREKLGERLCSLENVGESSPCVPTPGLGQ